MIRNFKALGLALVAVLAMGAVVASGASASEFTAESYPVTIEGEQSTQHSFTAGSTKVECEDAVFTGSASEASSEVTIHPEYSNCTAFGFVNATVNTEECDYVFHSGEETASEVFAGTVDVACPEGDSIKISAATCALEVKAQTGLSAVSFENTVAGVTVGAAVENIAYTTTADGFLCPLAGKGNFTNGGYTGDTAAVGAGGNQIMVSP